MLLSGILFCALQYFSFHLTPLKNKRASQAFHSLLKSIYPSAHTFSDEVRGKTMNYWKARSEKNRLLGFVFFSEWEGYADLIKVGVGVDKKGKIVQVRVLDENETPGFKVQFDTPKWLNQFLSLKTSEFGQINVVTGATISAKTVLHSVREGVDKLFRNEVLNE